MKTLPESVVRLLDAGYVVIPACAPSENGGCTAPWHRPCPDPGKVPLVKGYPNYASEAPTRAELEADLLSRPFAVNLGVVITDGMVAIDDDSPAADAEVIALLPNAPITPMRAPRPGRGHVWLFKVPGGIAAVRGTHRGRSRAIDVLAPGSFVIVPPSVHASGHPYDWAPGRTPWEVPLAELPETLKEIVERPGRTNEVIARVSLGAPPIDSAVAAARRLILARGHLRRLYQGESRGAGDASASGIDFSLARALLALGVKANVVVQIILERPDVHRATYEYAARTVTAVLSRKAGAR